MDFLRRLVGLNESDDEPSDPAEPDEWTAVPPELPPLAAAVRTGRPCPSCGALLDPPPVRNRLCPRCRQPIVVRRLDGRTVLLSESAVAIFEAQRRREADELRWTAERRRWLSLALAVKAAPARRTRLAAAPISAEVVAASRALYLSTAERVIKAARADKRWGDVGRLRREEAEALFVEAGSPIPPPDDIAALHREGMTAVLRSLAPMTKHVEVVSAECCRACRAEIGETFRVIAEIRVGRLPHAGCPKGLCRCDWWPAVAEPRRRRRRRTTATTGPMTAGDATLDGTDGPTEGQDAPTDVGGGPSGDGEGPLEDEAP